MNIRLMYEVCIIKGTVNCTVNKDILGANYNDFSLIDICKYYSIVASVLAILLLPFVIFIMWKNHTRQCKTKCKLHKKRSAVKPTPSGALLSYQGKQTTYGDTVLTQLLGQEKRVATKVEVRMVSPCRPKFWPGENIPYPGQDRNDKLKPRKGSGRLHLVICLTNGEGVDNNTASISVDS